MNLIRFELSGSGMALGAVAVVLALDVPTACQYANESQLGSGLSPDMVVDTTEETNLTGDAQTVYYWNGDY